MRTDTDVSRDGGLVCDQLLLSVLFWWQSW
jgi:hypothetical protein